MTSASTKRGLGAMLSFSFPAEDIAEQVANYETLNWFKSYRRLSAILLSVAAVLGVVLAATIPELYSWINIIVCSVLAIFVSRGDKRALIGAMAFWTISKGSLLIFLISNIDTTTNSNIPSLAARQVIWWYLYMNAFVGAFKVEQARLQTTRL